MQLTRFDRWLREKFVYETHIYTLRPPEFVPKGITATELPEKPGRRFRHKFVTRSGTAGEELIRHLKEQNMMFTTRIVDRKGWHVRFVAPGERSVTWWLFSSFMILCSISSVAFWVFRLFSDPVFMKNFLEAVDIFKG